MGRWQMGPTRETAGLMFTVGKKVEVSFDTENLHDAWFPATVLKNSGINSFLVEYQQPGVGDEPAIHKVTVDYLHIRPSPPHLRDKNFVLLENVDAYYDFGWWNGVITKELGDNRYSVFFKHTNKEREFIYSRVRPHMEWKGGKWFNTSQLLQRSKRGKSIELKTTIDSSRKKGRSANELRSLQASCKGGKGESVKPITGENLEKDIHCDGERRSQGKKLVQFSSERIPNVIGGETKQPAIPLAVIAKDAESIAPKKKRGRPPKIHVTSLKTPATVDHQNVGDGPSAVSVVEYFQRKEVGSGTNSLEEKQVPVEEEQLMKILPSNKDEENPGQNLNVQRGRRKDTSVKGKRGKCQTISINNSQDLSKEKDGLLKKDSTTRNPAGKSLDSMSDDQPLSRWLVHSVHGQAEASERRLEIVTLPPSDDMVAGDAEILPFVRSTPLWQMIESMEAFRKIPQRPHFRPLLEGVKESAREGLAIGSMVTFSTVVERTCGFRYDDPRSAIEDCLETLAELESHGFDVEVIRDRLTGLLLIKDKQEELEERSKIMGQKIEEHKIQVKRMDEEIGEIESQIRELEERRRQVTLKKEKRELEIGVVKTAGERIEQEMREVRVEFGGLAAAPL